MSNSRGRTLLIVVILLSAILLAAGNILCHALVVQELTGSSPPVEGGLVQLVIHAIGQSVGQRPQFVWFFSGAPLLVGLILALLVGLQRGAAPSAASAGAPGADGAADGALRLLALLQKEGRLVDFLEEDIQPYTDAQVGAAVRAIHDGCRKALHERMEITRIYAEDDGAAVEVASGFDPATVRLTGNVHGRPPFRGVLQHGGWRATHVALPKTAGVDVAVLAPAEVEIG
ncbi:MAG TPA: DUF2760 domain-containing protein [Candidatus Dormibacteraeota bacterium]|nr:DUF2760 domain-containing protein [Candidatus Dormibacteraeota bacterium]